MRPPQLLSKCEARLSWTMHCALSLAHSHHRAGLSCMLAPMHDRHMRIDCSTGCYLYCSRIAQPVLQHKHSYGPCTTLRNGTAMLSRSALSFRSACIGPSKCSHTNIKCRCWSSCWRRMTALQRRGTSSRLRTTAAVPSMTLPWRYRKAVRCCGGVAAALVSAGARRGCPKRAVAMGRVMK